MAIELCDILRLSFIHLLVETKVMVPGSLRLVGHRGGVAVLAAAAFKWHQELLHSLVVC